MENILYYLALFSLVFIIRYFKLKKEQKLELNKDYWTLLHVSLELIYTASGIVIALLLKIDQKWIPAIITFYIILVITSSLLEMANDKDFKPGTITKIHGFLVICIISFSVITYSEIIPNTAEEIKKTEVNNKPKYAIIIPYSDESLQKNAGKGDLKDRRFMYYSEVSGNNMDSIKRISIIKLRNTIKPLYKDSYLQIVIYNDDIKLFPINTN
jgi:hypothetical protein